MSSQYYFPPYNSSVQFHKFDVIYDYLIGGNLVYGYATQDSFGQSPSGVYNFPITAYSRINDITTVSFGQTGTVANMQPGSLVRITGVAANTSVNYTGMVIAGGSGTLQFLNPGWDQTDNAIVVGAINCPNPAWTTGFYWIPTYSTKLDVKNTPFIAKLGDGYEQRSPNGLNTYDKTYSMVFQQRSDKETRSIINFVESTAGANAFQIVMPLAAYENQPLQKYVADSVSASPDSYGLNTVQVAIRKVFDL